MAETHSYRSVRIKEKTLKLEGKRPIKYFVPQFHGAKKYATKDEAEIAINDLHDR